MRKQRIQAVKQLFLNKKEVMNTELCETFGVSIETVRRDLNTLEQEGFIRKIYGGARLAENFYLPEAIDKWDVRMDRNEPIKKRIAQRTAALIGDGCTVYLDTGTSVFEVATCLKGRKNLTVLTNSLRVAQELGMCSDIQVYFIGGIINTDTLASSGFFAAEFISYFYHIDCAVISCDGFLPDRGSTEYAIELAMLKRGVLTKADTIIIPVDHSKIGLAANCLCCEISQIDTVVTDEQTPSDAIAALRAQGVQVLIA